MGKQSVLIILILSLSAAILGSAYDPLGIAEAQRPNHPVAPDNYWAGSTDNKIESLQKQVSSVRDKVDDVCAQIVTLRIDLERSIAKTSGIYGGGVAAVGSLINFLILGVFRKKRNGNGNGEKDMLKGALRMKKGVIDQLMDERGDK